MGQTWSLGNSFAVPDVEHVFIRLSCFPRDYDFIWQSAQIFRSHLSSSKTCVRLYALEIHIAPILQLVFHFPNGVFWAANDSTFGEAQFIKLSFYE